MPEELIVAREGAVVRLTLNRPERRNALTPRLIDGGVSDPVPVGFAHGPTIGATHVIVSDCRWFGTVPAGDARTVWIRPRLASTGTLWSPRRGLLAAVRGGEAAVTDQMLYRIRGWLEADATAPSAPRWSGPRPRPARPTPRTASSNPT